MRECRGEGGECVWVERGEEWVERALLGRRIGTLRLEDRWLRPDSGRGTGYVFVSVHKLVNIPYTT